MVLNINFGLFLQKFFWRILNKSKYRIKVFFHILITVNIAKRVNLSCSLS